MKDSAKCGWECGETKKSRIFLVGDIAWCNHFEKYSGKLVGTTY